jgi:hypothetical protein
MRKSYGFRTFRCLELALYHSLGKLPEPESTNRPTNSSDEPTLLGHSGYLQLTRTTSFMLHQCSVAVEGGYPQLVIHISAVVLNLGID